MLAIFGLASGLDKTELKNGVMETLGASFTENHLSVKAKFLPRGKHFNHWVIEPTSDARKKLLCCNRIYIG